MENKLLSEITDFQVLELFKICFEQVFKNMDYSISEILRDQNSFGVVAYVYGSRLGFTYNHEDNWKEFMLTDTGDRLKVNQLELFEYLIKNNFDLT